MNKNKLNTELDLLQDVTILGYSGMYLALIFESLTSLNYRGKLNIITNETEKRAIAPFETNIPYTEELYSKLNSSPAKNYIFCSNKPSTKKILFGFYKNLWKINPNEFVQLIHPSSVISSSNVIQPGLQIEPLSVVAPYAKIGFGVNIGRNCSIGHHNVIGDFCSIFLGTNIAGSVEIGEGTTIGPGCTIFSKVKIGKNTIIGGGSVVTKDVPSDVLAFGNPCNVVKNLK